MARSSLEGHRSAIPIFDEFDQQYYKYIIDNVPEEIKNDPDLLKMTIRQAICVRYGGKSIGGAYNGKMLDLYVNNQDTFDHTFKIGNQGAKAFTVKNIPANPKQWYEKCTSRGWNPEDEAHGYRYGICSSPDMGDRAKSYIKFFEDGTMPDSKYLKYSPKYNKGATDASSDEKLAHQRAVEKGAKKSRNFGEFQEKSHQPIGIDEEDKKFLLSIKQKFQELIENDPRDDQKLKQKELDNWKYVAAAALGVRYSDTYIQEKDNVFNVKDSYKNKEEPNGEMWGNITIPYGIKSLTFKDVYLNLPHLVEKFQKNIKARNFVQHPILNAEMTHRKKDQGLLTATRWLDSGLHYPNSGTSGTETIFDQEFYKQIQKDWDAWRKRGDNAFAIGKPVSPEMQEKLVWRQGDKIIEPPNVGGSPENEKMSWEQMMEDNAKKGAYNAINFIARQQSDPTFAERMKSSQNFNNIVQNAKYDLMMNKTGLDPNLYRDESQRIKWAMNAAVRAMKEINKEQAKGDYGLEDKSGTEDRAVSKDRSLTVNTGKSHHREDDIEQPDLTPQYQEPETIKPSVPKVSEKDWEDYVKHLEQPKSQQLTLTKPANVPMRTWIGMSRDEKINAMKQAGMPVG